MAVDDNPVRNRGRWSRREVLVMATLALTSACATGPGPARGGPPTSTVAAAAAGGFDSATRDDAEFNRRFQHGFADVDGVRMHYVTGGTVEPRLQNITQAVEVPGAGHWLMAENPEFVTAELLAFLAG